MGVARLQSYGLRRLGAAPGHGVEDEGATQRPDSVLTLRTRPRGVYDGGMLRSASALALITSLFMTASAEAGVSYDFVFRDGPQGSGNGSEFTFVSLAAAQSGQAVMDVILTTTDPLTFASVSIGFDAGGGLSVASANEWQGIFLGMMATNRFEPAVPGVTVGPSSASSFDGEAAVSPLPPGTYNIGTVVWDTNCSEPGMCDFTSFLLPGVDGALAEIGGNIVDLTGTEVLGTGSINVVPEPGTAGLMGLGLLGLLLRGWRRGCFRSR